jgi:Mpv17 / PMP22 family
MSSRIRFIAKKYFTSSNKGSSPKSSNYNIWTRYLELLAEKPIMTKCITSGVLSCGADVVCQVQFFDEALNEKDTELDLWRVLKFTAIGSFFVGPVLHFWYGFLARQFVGASLLSTIQRVALDQLIFAPLFIPSFFSIILILDGKPEMIVNKIKTDWASTMITNYSVWVPAMFLNFKFVPPTLQVLFSNGVGFGWNIYLSYMSYKVDKVPEISSIGTAKEK